jgi:hypothetical protein
VCRDGTANNALVLEVSNLDSSFLCRGHSR